MKKALVKPSKPVGKNVKTYYSENPRIATWEQHFLVTNWLNDMRK